MRHPVKTAIVYFLSGLAAFGRLDPQLCGSHAMRGAEELALHRQSLRKQVFRRASLATPASSTVRDAGDIAIIEDSDGVVAHRNPFDLDLKSIQIVPANSANTQYGFTVADGGFDQDAANNGTPLAGLGDDDARSIDLPFPFQFFGISYTKIYLNSDGNLTFGTAEYSSTDRSVARMTAGPPRISPLFLDLDPSIAPNSVRVFTQSNRIVFSWINVPEYQSVGSGPPNNFQAILYPSGRIDFTYRGVTSHTGVVGIAPGNLQGTSTLLSFIAGSNALYSGAVLERFADYDEVDIIFAAQKFFETHEDTYDYLAIYNNLGIDAAPGAVAYEVTVRSDRLGIGDPPQDNGAIFGSPRRLQAVLNFGQIQQYPSDPNAIVPLRAVTKDTPLTVLGHEAGHLWLAYATVPDPLDPGALPMLGRQAAHWAFTFDSEASLLEGNRIRDNGPGVNPRFTTIATVEGYSALDQYLMGLRTPDEVPPLFLVTNSPTVVAAQAPQTGISFNGTRRDIQMSELVNAVGPRVPDTTVSQRHFRMAMILITKSGVAPTTAQLNQLNGYRQGFEPAFVKFASQRATMETSFKKMLQLSFWPAAGVLAGGSVNASITLAAPADADLTISLQAPSGVVAVPGSVTIPTGKQIVAFPLQGLAAGVEDVSATPADSRYATAYAKVQTLASAASLRLLGVSGDKQETPAGGGPLPQPLVIKVADANNLPYAGFEVAASVPAGGTVQPGKAISGADGLVSFTWTPAPVATQQFVASLTAVPSTTVALTALGKPAIAANGVVNAASFQPGVVPGSLATIFGTNLAGGSQNVNTVTVLVNATLARTVYASDGQLNVVIPESLSPGDGSIVVTHGAESTPAAKVTVKSADPGIFYDPATGFGAVANSGGVLQIYCTGIGARPELVTATVAGQPATVLYSGPQSQFPGVYQVNVSLPAGLGSGQKKLRIQVGDAVSNEVSFN